MLNLSLFFFFYENNIMAQVKISLTSLADKAFLNRRCFYARTCVASYYKQHLRDRRISRLSSRFFLIPSISEQTLRRC